MSLILDIKFPIKKRPIISLFIILGIIRQLIIANPVMAQGCNDYNDQDHDLTGQGVDLEDLSSDPHYRLLLFGDQDKDNLLKTPLHSCSEIYKAALAANHRTLGKKAKNLLINVSLGSIGTVLAATVILAPVSSGLFFANIDKNGRVKNKSHVRFKKMLKTSIQLFLEAEDYLAHKQENLKLRKDRFRVLTAFYDIYIKNNSASKLSIEDMARVIHQGNHTGVFCGGDQVLSTLFNERGDVDSALESKGMVEVFISKLRTEFKNPKKDPLSGKNNLPHQQFIHKWPHQKTKDIFTKDLYFHAFYPILKDNDNLDGVKEDIKKNRVRILKIRDFLSKRELAEYERNEKNAFDE